MKQWLKPRPERERGRGGAGFPESECMSFWGSTVVAAGSSPVTQTIKSRYAIAYLLFCFYLLAKNKTMEKERNSKSPAEHRMLMTLSATCLFLIITPLRA